MKTLYFILLTLLVALPVQGATPVSIEDFKKMDLERQHEVVREAPADQKEALEKIYIHHLMVLEYGGEEGLKRAKESSVASRRGLAGLEGIFNQYAQMWQEYFANNLAVNIKAGMTQGQTDNLAQKQRKEWEQIIGNRLPIVHSLVFHMAASPNALELEKKAEQLLNASIAQDLMTRDDLI